jgi:hypothetical protein
MPAGNTLAVPPLTFGALLNRLAEQVRNRVRNGDVTERGLAGRVGVSQPFLHNVLKEKRKMTPDLADRLIRELQIDLAALISIKPPARIGPGKEGSVGPGHYARPAASR